MNHILIMVDLQNDFMPGGALAVPGGDEVIAVANALQPHFEHVIATQDWHPANHESFVNLWPVHCVQNTDGAALADTLDKSRIERIIYKGTDPHIDSYSAFFDNEYRKETELMRYLQGLKASKIYIIGLATEYCVKFTVVDALKLGLAVYVIEDGCRGIDISPGDSARAIEEMKEMGAIFIKSSNIL